MKKYLIIFLLFLSFINLSSANVTDKDVSNFINEVFSQFTSISNSKLSQKEKNNKFKSYTSEIIDSVWISKFILGNHYKELNVNQRKDFHNLYKEYLVLNYMPKIQDYNSGLTIKSIKKTKNAYIASCVTKDKTNKNVNVDFRLSYKTDKTSNTEKFYITDIIPEGISFISSQRTEIDANLSKVGFDSFMKDLKTKVKNFQ